MSGMHRHRIKFPIRRGIQILAAVLFNGYAAGFRHGRIFTGSSKAVCVPVLNCYSCPGALGSCPIGSLQSALGSREHRLPFYVLGLLLLFGVLLGRLACGLLCPFGLVQDLLHKIPLPKLRVPERLDRPLRWLKYAVLIVLVILLPILSFMETGAAIPYFCKYLCPAGTLEGGIPLLLMNSALRQAAGALFGWKLLLLIALLAGAVFIYRPFCKYLCPLGAFYGLFNRFGFYQMKVEPDRCTGCKACERACPMNVKVTENINGMECIRCGQCKSACPSDAITSSFRLR